MGKPKPAPAKPVLPPAPPPGKAGAPLPKPALAPPPLPKAPKPPAAKTPAKKATVKAPILGQAKAMDVEMGEEQDTEAPIADLRGEVEGGFKDPLLQEETADGDEEREEKREEREEKRKREETENGRGNK